MSPRKLFERERYAMMFRALKHRNFKLFIEGQSLSLIGTWIQQIALTWLVYQMTKSAFMLGVVNFAGQIPFFIISPFGGILADRWNKHKLLIITQSLALVQALILSILVFTGTEQIWQIIILSLVLGIINAMDMPIRQSFVPEMIDNHKEDIGNAIALNSSMVNTARLVGPSVAGLLIATLGEGWCFLINSISFFAVVISLLRMKTTYVPKEIKKHNITNELKEGIKYTFGFPPLRYLIILLGIVGLISTAITILTPVYAKIYLNGSADTYGFLMGAYGLGALFSAVYLLSKKSVLGLGKIIATAVIIYGVSMLLFSFSRVFIISLIFMLFAGAGFLLEIASTNTLLQTISEENKRGRVMSFYAMSFRGMSPFGGIIAGSLGDLIGAQETLIIGGITCIASAFYFIKKLPSIRPLVRPIYENLGIITAVEKKIQNSIETDKK
jgi:MFS family permease